MAIVKDLDGSVMHNLIFMPFPPPTIDQLEYGKRSTVEPLHSRHLRTHQAIGVFSVGMVLQIRLLSTMWLCL